MLALCLFLALQEDPSRSALLFLARHQNEDGSWGAAPSGCRCAGPTARAPDGTERARLAGLVERLSGEEIAGREAAEIEILALGPDAVPELERMRPADGEARARVRGILERLRPPPERTDLELTALALLAYASYGYTHLSKDEHEGICFGTVVLKGLEWLDERKDSPSSPLAAIALSETYGRRWDDAVRRAEAVRDARPRDPESLAWRAIALHSAVGSEIVPRTFADVPSLAKGLSDRRVAEILSGEGLIRKHGLCSSGVSLMTPGTNRLLVLALDRDDPRQAGLAEGGWKGLLERTKPGQRTLAACERGSWDAHGRRRRIAETARRAIALHAGYFPYDLR